MIDDFKKAIGTLILTKQALAEADKQKFWPHHLPAVAATEQELAQAEAHLGFSLDPRFRAFLRFANGWPGLMQHIDLFGTGDLMGSSRMARAREIHDVLDQEGVLNRSGLTKEGTLAIAHSLLDGDLVLIETTRSKTPGLVVWFAGQEIDRFPTFDDFFLAMVDYNRLLIKRAKERNPS